MDCRPRRARRLQLAVAGRAAPAVLTYRYAGLNFRLTDVYGKVAKDIIA